MTTPPPEFIDFVLAALPSGILVVGSFIVASIVIEFVLGYLIWRMK